jgi:hypothetical protein
MAISQKTWQDRIQYNKLTTFVRVAQHHFGGVTQIMNLQLKFLRENVIPEPS